MNKNKGITLIALIITIIIMLILAAVSISVAVNGGLFSYAGRSAEEHQVEEYKQAIWNAQQEAKMASAVSGNISLEEIKSLVATDKLFKNATISEISNGEFTVLTEEGYKFTVTTNSIVYAGKQNGSTPVAKAFNPVFYIEDSDANEDTGCVHECLIYLNNNYNSVIEYWLKEEASSSQKESFGWLIFNLIYGNSATSYAMENQTVDISSVTEDDILAMLDGDDMFSLAAMYIANLPKADKIAAIINMWNSIDEAPNAEDIDTVLTYATGGTSTTLTAQAAKYHCTEDTIVDQTLKALSEETGNSIDYLDVQALYNELASDLKFGSLVTVTLPNGNVLTGDNFIAYSVTVNGDYTFQITKDGSTTPYTITVENIHHGDENYSETGWYPMNDYDEFGNSQHHQFITTYTCGAVEYGEIGFCSPSGEEFITSNLDGTHTRTYECTDCHAPIVYTDECYDNPDDEDTLCDDCNWDMSE